MKLSRSLLVVLATTAILVVFVAGSLVAQDAPKWIGAFYVKGKVGLKWQGVADATQYKVLRKAAGEEYAVLVEVEKPQYFDTDVQSGAVYSYKIVAVGAGGETESAEKSVTIPGATLGEFVPPELSGLRVDRNTILLRWDAVPGAIAYNIYRSTTSGSGYELVGNAVGNRHGDKDGLERGATYYYVVSAMNEEFDETEYSVEQVIKFGRSAEEIKAAEMEANKIELIDIKLTYLFEITASGEGDMNQPTEVVVNSQNKIYVADALNNQIHCFDDGGKFLFSFGSKTPTDMIDNPPPSTFSYPFSLAIDSKDQLYVGDVKNHEIQVFAADGKYLKKIRVAVDEGMEQFRPNGIHCYADGRLAVTDAGNHRFMILSNDGDVLLSKGERGAEPGQFIFPDGITVAGDGTICVVDVINCRIQEFDPKGNFVREFGEAGQTAGTFGRAKVITTDDQGRLWVSDALANLVQIFTLEGEVKSALTKFDREGVFLATPRGMFIKDGRFYIVNRLPHQVLVFKIG